MLRVMSIRTCTLVPALAVLMAACGSQQPATTPRATPTAAPTLAPSPAIAAAAPTATVIQPETQIQAPTSAATDAPALPSPTAPAVPALPLYNGIPHGVTPDGFYFLGNPAAPVTLTDYSDFL